MPLRAVRNGRVTVSTTYIDEDGDEITISSNEELNDAFSQFVNTEPPVLRAKATVVRQAKKLEQKRAQLNNAFNLSLKHMNEHLNEVEPAAPFPPVVRLPPLPQVAPAPKEETVKETNKDDMGGCDPNFIHGRHTCDGCLSTPIFGIRYHATNMPDYDLCSSCHSNYKGNEIKFKPMQLDRDRHLQSRWQRRRLRRMVKHQGLKSVGGANSGTQTRKVIENMDGALKEAIRRSLLDLTKEKKEKEVPVKAEETEAKPVAVSAEVNEEIPVAQVVDVSAGNEYTQKALDSMDPKVKEAISRSLNQFFARRANREKSCVEKDNDLNLVPEEETQKNIDSMDPAVKEAIRRSLNKFFASRRASKQNKDEEVATSESESESQDDTKRTQGTEVESQDKNVKQDVDTVVVDIVVDDNDEDLSEDESKIDVDNESKISEESEVKDEWQMVNEDDDMIAMAAQMLGSALFQSDSSLHESGHSS
jgi:hypothetical protein